VPGRALSSRVALTTLFRHPSTFFFLYFLPFPLLLLSFFPSSLPTAVSIAEQGELDSQLRARKIIAKQTADGTEDDSSLRLAQLQPGHRAVNPQTSRQRQDTPSS